MKSRRAIAQYEATVVLVVISLSLASVVYAGLRRESSLDPQPVFVNDETPIGGSPAIERLEVNSSSAATIYSLSIDAASSGGGILALYGSSYSTTKSLCSAGATTFFSILAFASGPGDGRHQRAVLGLGDVGDSVSVTPGWQEVMIQGGTSCSVTLPGGGGVASQWSPSSALLSSIPVEGALTGTAFTIYLPNGGGSHTLLLTSSGGFDNAAF